VEKDLEGQVDPKVDQVEKDLREKDPEDQEGHRVGLEVKDLQEKDLGDQVDHKVDQEEKEDHKVDLEEKEGHKMDQDLVWVEVKDLGVRGLVDQIVLELKLLEKGASVCLMSSSPC